MCVIQNVFERAGLTTIAVTMRPDITEGTRPVRALYHRFPLGYPMGEANKPDQQRTILRNTLAKIADFEAPGRIIDMPYRWRRM
ncbi:MAG: hypothetical protein HY690_05045 [Chloroflexi bacterium]|nr:hypothetical protein [Chloroflexota bacterium]